MTAGESLTLCDGKGTDYACTIAAVDKERVTLSVDAATPTTAEPTLAVTLYMGLPKGDKMELIIQKCVELGVTAIVPVSTSRCIVKLDGKWYYADPTWDDSDNPEFPLAYRYFNITYDEISTDHFLDAVYEPWVPKEPAIDANYYYHEGTLCNTPTVELLAALFRQQSPVMLYVTEDREAVKNFFFSHFYEIAEAIGAADLYTNEFLPEAK